MTTPNLMLPEVPRAIRNASPAINAGMLTIDAILQPAVISRAVSSQPTDPVQGDRYIIPGGASGVWNAHPGHIAYYGPNGWQYLVPRPGWLVWSIADGSFYVYTNGEWQEWTGGGSGSGVDYATTVDLFDDLIGAPSSSAGLANFVLSNSGSQSGGTGTSLDGHPGVWRLSTGTSSTGSCRAIYGWNVNDGTGLILSSDEILISTLMRVPILPDGTNTFQTHFGAFRANAVSTGTSNGFRFGIAWDGSQVVWRLDLRTGSGTGTPIDSTTPAPVANQWYYLQLRATSTEIRAYVDGALVLSTTTNIPTGMDLAHGMRIIKSAGTTARTVEFDFIRVQQTVSARY